MSAKLVLQMVSTSPSLSLPFSDASIALDKRPARGIVLTVRLAVNLSKACNTQPAGLFASTRIPPQLTTNANFTWPLQHAWGYVFPLPPDRASLPGNPAPSLWSVLPQSLLVPLRSLGWVPWETDREMRASVQAVPWGGSALCVSSCQTEMR